MADYVVTLNDYRLNQTAVNVYALTLGVGEFIDLADPAILTMTPAYSGHSTLWRVNSTLITGGVITVTQTGNGRAKVTGIATGDGFGSLILMDTSAGVPVVSVMLNITVQQDKLPKPDTGPTFTDDLIVHNGAGVTRVGTILKLKDLTSRGFHLESNTVYSGKLPLNKPEVIWPTFNESTPYMINGFSSDPTVATLDQTTHTVTPIAEGSTKLMYVIGDNSDGTNRMVMIVEVDLSVGEGGNRLSTSDGGNVIIDGNPRKYAIPITIGARPVVKKAVIGHDTSYSLMLQTKTAFTPKYNASVQIGARPVTKKAAVGHDASMAFMLQTKTAFTPKYNASVQIGARPVAKKAVVGHDASMAFILQTKTAFTPKYNASVQIGARPVAKKAAVGHDAVYSLMLQTKTAFTPKYNASVQIGARPVTKKAAVGHDASMAFMLQSKTAFAPKYNASVQIGARPVSKKAAVGHDATYSLLLQTKTAFTPKYNSSVQIGARPVAKKAIEGHDVAYSLLLQTKTAFTPKYNSSVQIGARPVSKKAVAGHDASYSLMLQTKTAFSPKYNSSVQIGARPVTKKAVVGHDVAYSLVLQTKTAFTPKYNSSVQIGARPVIVENVSPVDSLRVSNGARVGTTQGAINSISNGGDVNIIGKPIITGDLRVSNVGLVNARGFKEVDIIIDNGVNVFLQPAEHLTVSNGSNVQVWNAYSTSIMVSNGVRVLDFRQNERYVEDLIVSNGGLLFTDGKQIGGESMETVTLCSVFDGTLKADSDFVCGQAYDVTEIPFDSSVRLGVRLYSCENKRVNVSESVTDAHIYLKPLFQKGTITIPADIDSSSNTINAVVHPDSFNKIVAGMTYEMSVSVVDTQNNTTIVLQRKVRFK